MVGSGPFLYAKSQYAQSGYSERTVIIAFSDSVVGSDAFALWLQIALAEAVASSDAKVMAIAKVLFEITTAAEGILATIQTGAAETTLSVDDISTEIAGVFSEAISSMDGFSVAGLIGLAETLGVGDSFGPNSETVALTDFTLIKEFISLRLARSLVWTQGGTAFRGVVPHSYGNVLYGQDMYSTNIAILWKAIGRSLGPGFTNQNGNNN